MSTDGSGNTRPQGLPKRTRIAGGCGRLGIDARNARLPKMRARLQASPVVSASAILAVCLVLTYIVSLREQGFLVEQEIVSPEASVGVAVLYFAGSVLFIGGLLFFVPKTWLRAVTKTLFALTYCWGTFVVFFFLVPFEIAALLAVALPLAWLWRPKVWLHSLVMLLTLVGTASVFGLLFSPWTFAAVMLIISVYDILAVRFGYMVWMAQRLSESSSLPAFVIPRTTSGWGQSLSTFTFKSQSEKEPAERQFAVLGGGDIAFPLVLVVSVLASLGLPRSLIVAAFTFVGLGAAFWMQAKLLKGRPMPALPPISVASIIGFLIANYL